MTTPAGSTDRSLRNVVAERGPLDGSLIECAPADTEDGYPDEILVAGHGGQYVRKEGWWCRFVGEDPNHILPLYVWEGFGG